MCELQWPCAALILREQSDFANFNVLSGPDMSIVHEMWASSNFAITMPDLAAADRTDILHAQTYNINDIWKNTPGENELVFPFENSNFPSKFYTRAAGGEPSTKFPPGGLVEPAGIPDHSELPRLI